MTRAEAIAVLTQRRNWLRERVEAKRRIGWEIQWDERERDALSKILADEAERAGGAETI